MCVCVFFLCLVFFFVCCGVGLRISVLLKKGLSEGCFLLKGFLVLNIGFRLCFW